ncbi:hypothetical protein H5410_050526 [Solanum commersonii]|uniref:DUF1985 domain-containing protein n=1 Tax=Solanum commersonii TaxID=4109 RepID=A0A9J5WVQ4_SOLCO|nr:hypothetical protein H5410_050526 [Solanum commersonii]
MDEEETPSKRITRGFQEISGSIAKSRINQQEGMSKSSNTPLKMQEVMHVANSKGKTQKVDKHKEDKSVDVLTSKKKRKVKEIASTSNKQDKSVDVLISMKKRKVKEIASTKFVFNIEEPNRILQMYFSEKKSISKAEFVQSFNNKVWGDNVDDALKFGILYFIHSYILSEEPISTTIEQIDFDLVESGIFQIIFRNITPTPLEIAIVPLPSEYVQSDTASPSIPPSNIEADDVIQSPNLDDDFQDPPKSINNKGKEKVVSISDILPIKMVRQSVSAIPQKIPPKVVQDHDIKRPQTRITTSNNDSSQINLLRAEFDLFKLSSPIQSPSSSSGLQRPDEMNNLENNEVPVTDELSLDQKKEEDVLVNDEYVPDQIEDVQKQDSTVGVDQLDDSMQNAKEHIICVALIQMLSHVDASYNRVLTESPILIPGLQLSRLNPERSIVLHLGAGVVDETPIHRIKRPGSSSKLPVIFDQKHPFDSISGTHDTSLYTNFWKWLREGLYAFSHPKYRLHTNFDSFDIVHVNDIPRQPQGSLDCGLYISAYAEFLSDGNDISTGPFDPDLMRSKYAVLLWNYGMLKIQAEMISDSEALDKPIRSNIDVDSSERITII